MLAEVHLASRLCQLLPLVSVESFAHFLRRSFVAEFFLIGFESPSDFLLKIGRLFLTVQTDFVRISIALGVVLLVGVVGVRRGDVLPPRSLNAGPHGVLLYHDLE